MGYAILIFLSLPMIFVIGVVITGLIANATGLVDKN